MKKERRELSRVATNMLNQDGASLSFVSNLKEIIKNPESSYAGKVGLFAEIPELEKRKIDLDVEIEGLVEQKRNLDGYVKDTNGEIEKLESRKDNLTQEIKDLEAQMVAANDEQEKLKEDLNGELKQKQSEVSEAKKKLEENYKLQKGQLEGQIGKLKIKFRTSEDLSGIKSEAREHKLFYYFVIAIVALLLVISTNSAIKAGRDVITKYIDNPGVVDYFGLFLLKIPYALIVVGFISGAVILLGKLLTLVEKINNQLRDISQILAIAKTIEDKALDPFFMGSKEIEEEAKREDLKYKLISEYLERLSKREAEEKTKNTLNHASELFREMRKTMRLAKSK